MRNLKKVISSVAALAIVASTASAFAVSFPDVDASASYATAVESLTALGVVNGDDGLFKPDNSVTRAEFTKMAVEALGEGDAATSQTTSKFNDAANTTVHWAAGYIAQGVSDGFIDGYDETTFGPEDKVTYAQACKMLVAAIGYTQYAESQGGYPAGYVAQANTLGITKGVSSNNDKELTRAECAMLIYNAMDVSLCVIDSYDTDFNYMTGETISKPVYKKLDGKEGRDYQTLLTDRHDAYKVKGRVTATSKGGSAAGLEKDEVTYSVESADNYDDILDITKDNVQTETMKVGDTKAADMLFEYTEALVQIDEDSDDVTILSITSYGNSKSVTIAANDVADDDSTIGTEYVDAKKIPVYKSSTTSSTTKYDLSVDSNDKVNAIMYVNGVEAGVVTDEMIDEYILQNSTGTVTLVDVTNTGSTSTDGKYEYIMVDYYVDAVVDSVQTSSSNARIYFKFQDAPIAKVNRMQWDPEDEDIDINFTLNDAPIAYTDLQENDVLSIAFDAVNNDTLTDLEYYDIKVSRNTVVGTVTSRDGSDGENTVRVDGQDYDVINAYNVVTDVELSTEYTLYLDTFGYVAYIDEGASEKNYGVIVAMYQSAGNDQPTVRMITSDAQVVAYECKEAKEADAFYNYATGTTAGYQEGGFTKTTLKDRIMDGETVCEYKLSSGKAKFDKSVEKQGGTGLEFKANSNKLDSYSLNESVTKLIDMDGYMNGGDTTVGTLSVSSFEDEATYTAWLYGKNNNGDYRFAMILDGTSSIRKESTMAVVAKVEGTTDVDGTTCTEIKVARDGQEDISVLLEGEPTIAEGSVIAYTVGTDGYVESGKLYTVFALADTNDYDTLYADTLKQDKFNGMLKEVVPYTYKGIEQVTPSYGSPTSKDVVLYFGPVYRKSANNLEIFTSQTDKTSSTVSKESFQSFGIAGANSYVYDFAQKSKYRVSVGSSTQNNTIFNQSYEDSDKSIVSWTKATDSNTLAEPAFALVKVVDGDVIDVVYYVAP